MLFLLLVIHTVAGNLEGTWTNELGSNMTISANKNLLSGMYTTAVSFDDKPVTGPLTGVYITTDDGVLFTFSVTWKDSLTTWIGKCTGNHFTGTWLLQLDTPKSQSWASLLTGQNTFRKV